MSVKTEVQTSAAFDIDIASSKWLTNYLDPSDKTKKLTPENRQLRAKALDYAIRSFRIEGIRSRLQNRVVTSNKSWSKLRSLEAKNGNKITELSETYGVESRFLRLYSASLFKMVHFASNLEKDNQMPRAAALRTVGVVFKRQKEKVLTLHPSSVCDSD